MKKYAMAAVTLSLLTINAIAQTSPRRPRAARRKPRPAGQAGRASAWPPHPPISRALRPGTDDLIPATRGQESGWIFGPDTLIGLGRSKACGRWRLDVQA
jgi:hypothetical protein